ncbi:MAG: prepilin-type N-terminal cleavage/methylation domain-containing protein, partial [Planctomycetes bacterium]|nr:prepilin-type N-terminal cleavage/methylation domain-containing protein [Planctomycetota bacterium]
MMIRHTVRKAFTLLEVLIVVIVIGILAALIIPQMSEAAGSAKVSRIIQLVDATRTAVQTHHADTGKLAREFSNSTATIEHQLSIRQDSYNWNGPYLDRPLAGGENPYGGIVRVYDRFDEGPAQPVGFDLLGRGSDTATGAGQYLLVTQISEIVGREIDAILDRGVSGDWRATGRVEWANQSAMIYLMDLQEVGDINP